MNFNDYSNLKGKRAFLCASKYHWINYDEEKLKKRYLKHKEASMKKKEGDRMNFNKHASLNGMHAFLGASKYHWINYDEEKVAQSYLKHQATMRGTVLHDFAAQCIQLGQKLPKSHKTLNMYVNDAIGYKMTPEQVLFYSENCFGTADAIMFRNNLLRIHDLKTGVTKAHMEQLEIYAALFCLEYKMKPSAIDMELRIYQNDDIIVHNPTVEDILPIMDKIVSFDKILRKLKEEEE